MADVVNAEATGLIEPNARASWLGPAARKLALKRLAAETFDVLVIGGGVTGCGVALDAATRGLTVALVEKRDFAAGTSSRSSKLIHGGLRYLEHLDVKLVREALHERRLLLETIAPHLVRATPFLFPLKRPLWDRFFMGSGLFMDDATIDREATHYRARLAAELEAESMPDDASSDAVRATVRDLRLG